MVKNKMNSGCAYGKVSRNMIDNLTGEFREFRKEIKQEFYDMKKLNTDLYNHLSARLPPWATAVGAIGIAILSAIAGVLIGRA